MGRYGSPQRQQRDHHRDHSRDQPRDQQRDRRSWQSPSHSNRRRSDEYKSKRSRSRSRSRSHSHSRSRSGSSERNDERGYRLHIADLSPDCTRKELELAFQKFGQIQEVWLARSPQCFAFVVFQHNDDARDAIEEMHGKKFCGQRIRVTKARPRTRGQRTYRSYNPNLRCYECGKRGHFSRDCRLNDHTDSKKRDMKTMSVHDLVKWDITDEDVVRFNMSPEQHSRRSRSRSSSSSSSSSSAHSRRRKRSRHSSSGSSHKAATSKDENANSTKNETEETTASPTAPSTSMSNQESEHKETAAKPQATSPTMPPGMVNSFSPVFHAAQPTEEPAIGVAAVKPPEVRTVMMNQPPTIVNKVADISQQQVTPSLS